MISIHRASTRRACAADYRRKPALVLLNGLSEQAESWYPNHQYWSSRFEVHMPNLVVYDGKFLQQRIENRLPIDLEFLIEQLRAYLIQFAQSSPYHLVASSLGGKIAIEYAARYPREIARIVLLCPSGMGDEEKLPVMDGLRRHDVEGLVASVFHDRRHAPPQMIAYYKRQFQNRHWRIGLIKTIRGTMDHVVRPRLPQVGHPTLLVSGENDCIVSPDEAKDASRELGCGFYLRIPRCGHAPQLEKSRLINRLVSRFLLDTEPGPMVREVARRLCVSERHALAH